MNRATPTLAGLILTGLASTSLAQDSFDPNSTREIPQGDLASQPVTRCLSGFFTGNYRRDVLALHGSIPVLLHSPGTYQSLIAYLDRDANDIALTHKQPGGFALVGPTGLSFRALLARRFLDRGPSLLAARGRFPFGRCRPRRRRCGWSRCSRRERHGVDPGCERGQHRNRRHDREPLESGVGDRRRRPAGGHRQRARGRPRHGNAHSSTAAGHRSKRIPACPWPRPIWFLSAKPATPRTAWR